MQPDAELFEKALENLIARGELRLDPEGYYHLTDLGKAVLDAEEGKGNLV